MAVTLKQAGSFALLVNELVSNALKHGKGKVEVTLTLGVSSRDEAASEIPMAQHWKSAMMAPVSRRASIRRKRRTRGWN